MSSSYENSGFETNEANLIKPSSASVTELLPFQSNSSLVYKIRINDKWLLLKRIHPDFRTHPLYTAALEKEFDIGFNLDHPHIVKYLNKGRDSEGLYLIAEYIDGASLRAIISQKPNGILDKKFITKIFFQLLDALGYLHKHQIFHLDLKPENIIISHKGNNVKIIDFGLSGSDSFVSQPAGTKKYSAPEQLKNPESADARSDLYSLGLIIIEMFTGNADLSGVKNLPSHYKSVVSKCIDTIQEKRYQSAEDVKIAIQRKSRITKWLVAAILVFIATGFYIIQYLHHEITIVKVPTTEHEQVTNLNKSLINDNSSYNKTKKSDNISYSASLMDSKNKLDSIKQKHNAMLSASMLASDSVKICELGKNLYSAFLNTVNEHEREYTTRSRKLVLIEVKGECIDSYNDSLNNYISKYEIGSIPYIKLSDLYHKHADVSENRIDNYISRLK